jgi:serine/threonine protein kinase
MEITPDNWKQAKALFDAVLERPAAERASFLARICPEDELRAQVEELLRNHEQAGSFLSKPVLEHHKQDSAEKSHPFTSGTIIASRFKINRLLGKGGMGEVFEAEDLKLRRQVALKFLPEELSRDPQSLERFEREARAASALDHPNICTIYEIGEHAGLPFIAMQFLDGKTLQEYIQGKPLKTATVLDFGIQITDALNAAHSKGIIHRDIKPPNIFITTLGQIKILDFGLAKHQPLTNRIADAIGSSAPPTASLPEESLTSPGSALGTVAYMSPEQVRGEDLDARTDLFSFGAVLYEMATGQHAFSGRTTGVIFDAILNRQPLPARKVKSQIPLELEQIIQKALEKDRDVRYQHASEIRADLKRLKRDSESGRLATITIPSTWFRPRFGRWAFVFGGILLIASVFFAFGTWSKRQEPFHVERNQRRLTANPGDNPVDAPVISSDGKYLAYSDKGGIRIKLLETGELQTIPAPPNFKPGRDYWTPAAWFPDSTRILVNGTQSGTSSIWIISILRGTARLLRENSRAWSVAPNGLLIVFTTGTLSHLWNADREIWLMGPDGDNARRFLVADQDSGFTRVMWQPNGQAIAYLKITCCEDNSIETRDLQSRLGTVIWAEPDIKDFCFLRDGRVIFSRGRGYYEAADADLWEIKLDLSTAKPRAKPVQLITWPNSALQFLSATADGSHLVFLKSSYQTQVYVGELEDGGTRLQLPRRLTKGEATHRPAAWTPDSKAVLFSSDINGSWDIYKQALDKDEPELLTSGPEFKIDPRLSPDDKWILYTAAPISNAYEILSTTPVFVKRVPVSGGAAPVLIVSTRGVINPFGCGRGSGGCVWAEASADRKQVTLYSFDPIKGRGHQLATTQDINAEQVDVSPDGSMVAWLSDRIAGLIRLLSFENGKTWDLKIEGWNALNSLDWAIDGKGFFVSSGMLGGSTLLHVDLHGRAQALWHQDYPQTWGVPSPDGRRLAMLGGTQDGNVWMMENF